MYLRHFDLAEAPFSIAPDPRYLYLSQRHKEALAHLLFGLQGDGGFVVLSGEIGAGKTTVCRCLLAQIPDNCDVAYVFNPKLTAEELLATLCGEFRIPLPDSHYSIKSLVDALNAFLLAGHAKGRHAVLMIDEAQNLSADVLEQMRLLTNLETHQRKLLQIILIGQPELDEMLARSELRQLAQRVIARYHLASLSREEVAAYISHRLEVAGCHRPIVPANLSGLIYRLTGGVPRLVNMLCDRALLGAYAEGQPHVSARILRRAAKEILPTEFTSHKPKQTALLWVAFALVLLALTVYWPMRHEPPPAANPAATRTPANRPTPAPANTALKAIASSIVTATSITPQVDMEPAQSLQQSYTQLYQRWQLAVPEAGPCSSKATLRCRTARGGLDELRQINRPALLYLSSPAGTPFHAVLIGLNQQTATLVVGDTAQTVSLDTLATQWSGRYALLWRAPLDLPDMLRASDTGDAIAWLARQLALAQGIAEPSPLPTKLDADLREGVKRFQLAHGLAPDGQIGIQTLVRLSTYGDRDAPTLHSEQP